MRMLFLLLCVCVVAMSSTRHYDVCIYGGNSAAVTAACSAARMGKKVVVVSPDLRLGGMTTGGLGYTDIGNKQVVFGLAKQFYRKLGGALRQTGILDFRAICCIGSDRIVHGSSQHYLA